MSSDSSLPPSVPGLGLLLELVRTQAEAQCCPGCHELLGGCGIEIQHFELDAAVVAITCTACGRRNSLTVRPSAEDGTATVRCR